MTSNTGSRLRSLSCPPCGSSVPADGVHGTCPTCHGPLFATYDLADFRGREWWERIPGRPASLWRYRELLPVRTTESVVTLGEGLSPVLHLGRPAEFPQIDLSVKDDGGLPTGSFKARGMAVAVSRARELGLRRLFVPSAGNAGIALAAYAARAGLSATVYLPRAAAPGSDRAASFLGANVVRAGETIRDAGEEARRREAGTGAFDMSTLREPYRVEGKKTMALEIVEQCGADALPDAIVYPTGGGTGLVGMHKGFAELRELGLVEGEPRLIAVQSTGCAPVVRAIEQGAPRVEPWAEPRTIASGLLVPAPFGSERVLDAIRASKGSAVAVSDSAIASASRTLASRFGLLASSEGAATWAALPELLQRGLVRPDERILLYNTGTGLAHVA